MKYLINICSFKAREGTRGNDKVQRDAIHEQIRARHSRTSVWGPTNEGLINKHNEDHCDDGDVDACDGGEDDLDATWITEVIWCLPKNTTVAESADDYKSLFMWATVQHFLSHSSHCVGGLMSDDLRCLQSNILWNYFYFPNTFLLFAKSFLD